ncbi:MAG: alpha/beta hydrolase [Ginsengibacter sp.]
MLRTVKFLMVLGVIMFTSCHSKIKERSEQIYSRHLQKHITLTVISTPPPSNKSDFNLLLLNNGFEAGSIRKITDSLYHKKDIKALLIVAIKPFDAQQEFGVAGVTDGKNNGSLASKYSNFIVNELLPFIKKKSAVRSFKSVTIAGVGDGGISAFDIAWDNWQKFDKVAVLQDFSNPGRPTNFSVITTKIAKSRKRPKLHFWLETGKEQNELNKEDSSGINNLIETLRAKNIDQSFVHVQPPSNSHQSIIDFLLWVNNAN